VILASLLLAAPFAFGQGSSPVAGGVVSSKEWRVKRGVDKEEEFIGDVRYRTGPSVIRSDWALYKHGPQTWQLRGNVRVDRTLDSGDRVESSGDHAFFEMKKKAGWVTADDLVALKRTPADGTAPDFARAQRLEWKGKERGSLIGAVHLWGPRVESWSDRADWDEATGEILMTGGRPVARKFTGWNEDDDWAGALKGDTVRAWQSKRKLSADGKVVGWLEFKDVKGLKK
jgi:hypothetical protein